MEKKSFLIYRDNAPMVRKLPLEEVGRLFLALLEYGDTEGVTPEDFLTEHPMDGMVELVFGFMAANIYRDSQKWRRTKETKEARRAANREAQPQIKGSTYLPYPGF